MDLNVHKAILYCALKKTDLSQSAVLQQKSFNDVFINLWQGNWLTDMNQASCFFSFLPDNSKMSPYKALENGVYTFPQEIIKIKKHWLKFYNSLWDAELESLSKSGQKITPTDQKKYLINDLQQIGVYYPYDHFDVIDTPDTKNNPIRMDNHEFESSEINKITDTINEAVNKYVLSYLLKTAFDEREKDEIKSLRFLGHALHTLADFYAHSNFVELLLFVAGNRNLLEKELTDLLKTDDCGTFISYIDFLSPEETPVMSGRFDTIDTLASLIGIYKKTLLPQYDDLEQIAISEKANVDKQSELVFNLLLGTFSNNPYLGLLIEDAQLLNKISGCLKKFKTNVLTFVSNSAFDVANTYFKDSNIEVLKGLTSSYIKEQDTYKKYIKTGKLQFWEHIIEDKLRNDVADANLKREKILPHHTLLAKDKDVSQPECRLAYKMGCILATKVTNLVLDVYLTGKNLSDVEPILKKYYCHPVDFLNNQENADFTVQITKELYGIRWWQYDFASTKQF